MKTSKTGSFIIVLLIGVLLGFLATSAVYDKIIDTEVTKVINKIFEDLTPGKDSFSLVLERIRIGLGWF